MRAVVVYESMFGNTRRIAEAIGSGIATRYADVTVVAVGEAAGDLLDGAALVVVGGPTHMHGMSRASSRRMAGDMARKPDSGVVLEPGADGDGLREWFATVGHLAAAAAAYDTRMRGLPALTGRASRRIDRLLRRQGAQVVAPPVSFLVTKDSRLVPGELDRARRWGERLARSVSPVAEYAPQR